MIKNLKGFMSKILKTSFTVSLCKVMIMKILTVKKFVF